MCAVCVWVIFSLIQCDCFILNSVQCGRFILVCSLVVLQNSQCIAMCCVCVQGAAHCVWCPFWSVGCESKESTKWNVCSFSCSKYIYTVSSVQCVSQNFCYFLFFFIGQFQYVCVFSVFFLSFSFSFYWTVSVCVHCSVCCTRCSRFVGSQLVLCRETHIYIGDLAVAALGKTDRHAHTNRQMNTHEPNSWTSTNTQTHKHTNTQTQTDR